MRIQHELIIQEARTRGLIIQHWNKKYGKLASVIGNGHQEELIIEGTPISLINRHSAEIFDDKHLCKIDLEKLGIPYPKSLLFHKPKDIKGVLPFHRKKSYVCKPVNLTEGIGVNMDIINYEQVEKYWAENKHLSDKHMLEEQIDGEDLRIQVVGGRLVAACTRVPPIVIGDGQRDLQNLIDQLHLKVKSNNPNNELSANLSMIRLINGQNIHLQYVPREGEIIQLNLLANMSQGALAIDKSGQFHPDYHVWVAKICRHFKVGYFALDIITTDITKSPYKYAKLLEINARPEWVHHTFSEGKQHDIPVIILDELFS